MLINLFNSYQKIVFKPNVKDVSVVYWKYRNDESTLDEVKIKKSQTNFEEHFLVPNLVPKSEKDEWNHHRGYWFPVWWTNRDANSVDNSSDTSLPMESENGW